MGAAIFGLLAIRDNVAPPTLNLQNPSVATALDLVPLTPRKRQIDVDVSAVDPPAREVGAADGDRTIGRGGQNDRAAQISRCQQAHRPG